MPDIKNSLGELLVVDDDKIIIKLLTKIFEKYCTVNSAESGEEALEMLKAGYRPGVILSDLIMPNMSGSEFLAKTAHISPNSKRILLTGASDSDQLIKAVNEAKAFMYITKPFENILLIKVIANAFEEYNLRNKLTSKIKELNAENNKLSRKIEMLTGTKPKNEDTFTVVKNLFYLSNSNAKFHFRQHNTNVSMICRYLASEFDLVESEKTDLVFAAFIHNIYNIGLKEELQLIDPPDMTSAQKNMLTEKFIYSFSDFLDNSNLNAVANICMKMWEKSDGKGFPNYLTAENIPFRSKILYFAVRYENLVYRMESQDLSLYNKESEIIQTPEQTKSRHNEAIKILTENVSFYEQNLAEKFRYLEKFQKCPALVPSEETLKIRKSDY